MQQLAVDGHADQLEHDVIWQLDGIHELTDGIQAARIDQLHQQAEEFRGFDSGCRDILGLGRHAMDKVVQRLLGDGSVGHETISQAASKICLKVERVGHMFDSDQLRLQQQITQSHSFVDGTLRWGWDKNCRRFHSFSSARVKHRDFPIVTGL